MSENENAEPDPSSDTVVLGGLRWQYHRLYRAYELARKAGNHFLAAEHRQLLDAALEEEVRAILRCADGEQRIILKIGRDNHDEFVAHAASLAARR